MRLHAITLALLLFLLTPFAFSQTAPVGDSVDMRAATLIQRIVQQGGPTEVGVFNSAQFVPLVKPTTVTCPPGPGANPLPSTCLVTVTVTAEMDNSDPRSAGTYGAFRINTMNDTSIANVNKSLTSFNHVWKSETPAGGMAASVTRSFTFLLSVSSDAKPHTFHVELGCLNASGGNTCYQGTYGDDPFNKRATPGASGGPTISVVTDVFKPLL